jgi:hypothetical protein
MQGNRVKLDKESWYEHVPKSVETSQEGKVTTLWNQKAQTHRTIHNNKPDIIIRDNEKGTCVITDVAILGDRKVIKKEAENIVKYKDLTIDTECMMNVKTKVLPVITGATRTISKSFRNTQATYRVSTKSRNFRKQPYWALHTYFGKY